MVHCTAKWFLRWPGRYRAEPGAGAQQPGTHLCLAAGVSPSGWKRGQAVSPAKPWPPDMERKAMRGAGRGQHLGLSKESNDEDDGETWRTTTPDRTSRDRPKAGKGGGNPGSYPKRG